MNRQSSGRSKHAAAAAKSKPRHEGFNYIVDGRNAGPHLRACAVDVSRKAFPGMDALDPLDREILQTCNVTAASFDGVTAMLHHSDEESAELLRLMCASGRCFLKRTANAESLSPLQWDDGEPWYIRVFVERNAEKSVYSVSAKFSREGRDVPLRDGHFLSSGMVSIAGRAARLNAGDRLAWVREMHKAGSHQVTFWERESLVEKLASLAEHFPVEMPEELRLEHRTLAGPPHLTVRVPEALTRDTRASCEIAFDYGGGLEIPESLGAIVYDPSRERYFLRDSAAEADALGMLDSVGIHSGHSWRARQWEIVSQRLPAALRALDEAGWRIETVGGSVYRRPVTLRLEVKTDIDWFDLEGYADFTGATVRLPEILNALRRGEAEVRFEDGSVGMLPEDWIERFRRAAGFGRVVDGQVRFSKSQAGLLEALLSGEPDVVFDAGFHRVRREIETFGGVEPADPEVGFEGALRGYQREGLGWLHFLRRFGFGGCLADDMGLGKTVQILALLDSNVRKGPALVVAPRSLIFNWKQEAAKFTPRLRVLDLTGSGRRERWENVATSDLVLTTYGTLRRDIELLQTTRFDTVVLDEAQAIKNAGTDSAKAARLLQADHRVVLTGTPVENRIQDLWSLFEFLNPGMLGSVSIFEAFTNPEGAGFRSGEIEVLAKALRPFILRRLKGQVAKDLPEKTELTIYCELDAEERRVYDELRDHYRDSLLGRIDRTGIERQSIHILEALLRLRQAACHPGLIDKTRAEDRSTKIDTLLEQIAEVVQGGHKALVFSQFTSLLAILKSRLNEEGIPYEYLDGRTRDREKCVRRFQEDADCPLFLISLKAGGVGLNLTAAEYVFLLDPWWNPAAEAQAIDRSHRIGQTKRVFAYRLIARDTVEEKVLELQQKKRDIAGAIVTTENGGISGLTRESLELLLS